MLDQKKPENTSLKKEDIEKAEAENVKPKDQLIFSNHIYIELPGLNGFEHPIYDIRPLSCS